MAAVTISPAYNTNLYKNSIYQNTNSFREASFSSYLTNTDEQFIKKLVETTLEPSPTIRKDPSYQMNGRIQKAEDEELCIFGAEKYFNGEIDENSGTKKTPQKDGRIEHYGGKPKITPGTPSKCSEVSSKSHSLLLPGRSKDSFPNGDFKANGNKFFTIFGCNCKQSVDINEQLEETNMTNIYEKNVDPREVKETTVTVLPIKMHSQSVNLARQQIRPGTLVTFPNSNSEKRKFTIKMRLEEKEEDVEKARNSMEVFGSPTLDKKNITSTMENKVTNMSSDSTSTFEDNLANSNDGRTEEDYESDSSSDLFEIKSLSSNPHPFLNRQVSGNMSICASPLTCYEPSEASIEWSVVTASSPATMFTNFEASKSTKKITPTKGKSGTGRRPSMLSGCRSYKAVNVVEEPYRISEKSKPSPPRHHRMDSFTPITQFQAETKMMTLIPRMHNVY